MQDKNIINAFNDICDFFNNENVMTQEDFNNICDYYNSEESIRNSNNYEVIFDDGKPYEKVYDSEESLKEGLKEFYLRNNNCEEAGYYDIFVYCDGEDITESQFIEEMVSDILEQNKCSFQEHKLQLKLNNDIYEKDNITYCAICGQKIGESI